MRKLFALALVAFGFAACQTEPEGLDVNMGDGTTTISVVLPEEAITRAGGTDSAASGLDNVSKEIVRVVMRIYDENGNVSEKRYVDYLGEGETTVNFDVRLVPNRKYTFVAWADQVDDKADVDKYFNTQDLAKVTIIEDTWTAMNEDRDAFTATHTEANYTSSSNITLKLTRPFAKLRVVTTDMKNLNDLSVEPTKATVTYRTPHYTAFDAVSGKAIAKETTASVAHKEYTIASYGENSAEGADMTLFTDYFFAADEAEAVNFEFSVYDQNGKLIKSNNFNTDIPVKRNNLTTLKGNILTDGGNIKVTVDKQFGSKNDYNTDDGTSTGYVDTAEEFENAFNGDTDTIILDGDINLDDLVTRAAADKTWTVDNGRVLTIDLNGHTLSATSVGTGKNYNLLNVTSGTLTVKNGTIEYKHVGENMYWNNCTSVFYAGNKGTLNIEEVVAKNLGGSDMAYVVDMTNAVDINVNIDKSNLESKYIAVRVFNNSKTGVNNVDIKNTILSGKYCFWVQYWLADGRDEATLEKTLNINIFNQGNTFNNTGKAPVMYGFNKYVYCNEHGNEVVFDVAGLQAAINDAKEGENLITLAADITGNVVIEQAEGKNITIDGANYKYDGTITVDGKNRFNGKESVTIRNINFESTTASPFISCPGEYNGAKERYSHNVTIDGCTFTSPEYTEKVSGISAQKTYHLTVKNCEATNIHSLLQVQSCDNDVTIENVKAINCKNGISVGNTAYPTINGAEIDVKGYGVRGDADAARGVLKLNDVKITAAYPVTVRKAKTDGYAIEFSGANTLTTENDYQVIITKNSEESVCETPAGTYTITGADNFIVYPRDIILDEKVTLEDAIKDGGTSLVLPEGTYIIPDAGKGKTLTFIGSGDPEDTVIATNTSGSYEGCNYALDGSTVTFKNITITTDGNTYTGYARCNGTYENCIINNTYTLYGDSEFINCTFNVSGDAYNIWTWGAPTAKFTNCTFNCDGKSMLLYGNPGTKLTMTDCTFNDNGGLSDLKAAIEVGTDWTTNKYELEVNNATVNGFEINDKGINTGTTLWANKNSMPKERLKVVVDGVEWDGSAYIANGVRLLNGEYLISNENGMFWFANEVNVNKKSFSGVTVKLVADIDLNNSVWTPIGQTGATTFNGVFDGQNYTISNLNVNSDSQTGEHYSSGLFGWIETHSADNGILKNININGANVIGHHNCGALVGYITDKYAVVENCHVSGASISCTFADSEANGDKAGALIGNATVSTIVKDCTATDSTVSAGRDCGQLIGAAKETNVTGCSATNVTVSDNGTSTGANIRNEVIGRLLE